MPNHSSTITTRGYHWVRERPTDRQGYLPAAAGLHFWGPPLPPPLWPSETQVTPEGGGPQSGPFPGAFQWPLLHCRAQAGPLAGINSLPTSVKHQKSNTVKGRSDQYNLWEFYISSALWWISTKSTAHYSKYKSTELCLSLIIRLPLL